MVLVVVVVADAGRLLGGRVGLGSLLQFRNGIGWYFAVILSTLESPVSSLTPSTGLDVQNPHLIPPQNIPPFRWVRQKLSAAERVPLSLSRSDGIILQFFEGMIFHARFPLASRFGASSLSRSLLPFLTRERPHFKNEIALLYPSHFSLSVPHSILSIPLSVFPTTLLVNVLYTFAGGLKGQDNFAGSVPA